MRDWLRTLHDELAAGAGPVVRVVVAATRGSAPREPGATMLVTASREIGTIGGGHLELVATRIAREMLGASHAAARTDRFSLGASLGQCCGGIVELEFRRHEPAELATLAEALRARDASGGWAMPHETRLWLFGAGHVGKALVRVLSPLPFAIAWVDSREAMFPADLPANVKPIHTPDPADEVARMQERDWALVMTHSHDEDFAICRALLEDGRFGWAGVIGSAPKTARFRQRLAQRGFSAHHVSRLSMPIGIGGIASKEAAAIAVAVAAQLLQLREAQARRSADQKAALES